MHTTVSVRDVTGPRRHLGGGAFGQVFALDEFRVPEYDGPLAYKQFATVSRPTDQAPFEELITTHQKLPPQQRKAFAAAGTWPLRVVVADDGGVDGVLMPLLSEEWFDTVRNFDGVESRETRGVDALFIDAVDRRHWGWAVPDDDDLVTRLRLCLGFASCLDEVHRAGVVFGDISPTNVVYRLTPETAVRLIDCDAARVVGTADPTLQTNTLSWYPPEHSWHPALDQLTDRYKLGLLILRCLASGHGAATVASAASAANHLDDEGLLLLERALAEDRNGRPTAGEWREHLARRVAGLTSPPEVVSAEIWPRIAPLGERVTIALALIGADTVVLTGPSGFQVRVAQPGGLEVVTVVAEASGCWSIQAENRFGRSPITRTAPLTALVPPEIRLEPVPDVSPLKAIADLRTGDLQRALDTNQRALYELLGRHPAAPSPVSLLAGRGLVPPDWPAVDLVNDLPVVGLLYADPPFDVDASAFDRPARRVRTSWRRGRRAP